MTQELNKSSQFLLPIIDVDGPIATAEFQNSFLSDGTHEIGTRLYAMFDSTVSAEHREKLEKASNFERSYDHNGSIVFVYTIPEDKLVSVVGPFLVGKYSQMSTTYVDKHFPDDPTHKLYGNRMVIDKSPRWVTYWSEKGVELPENAEVWSRPDLSKEILVK